MRVGILTFHYALNDGAILQAYGLQETLLKMGADAAVIDYHAPAIVSHNKPLGIRSGRFMYVLPMRWHFYKFRKKYLRLTRRLSSISDVEAEAKRFDAIIVGSDQVWNTNLLKGADPVYFLGFKGSFKKISYAACFGQREQQRGIELRISQLLQGYHHLSVRNETSREMVTKLTGRIPAIVLDPSLIHDYAEFSCAHVNNSTPYILIYSIWPDSGQHIMNAVVNTVSAYYRCKRISLSRMWDPDYADRHIRTADPLIWTQAFKDAAFVCTDSFHGVMFAIKYRKPFIAVAENLKSMRILDVLHRYKLESRLISKPSLEDLADICQTSIDYDGVYERLEKDIGFSKAFLENALFENNGENGTICSEHLNADRFQRKPVA